MLMGTKGPSAARDSRCTSRAATSLPVPLSPVMSTVAGVGATLPTRAATACMAGLPVTQSGRAAPAERADSAASFSRSSSLIRPSRRISSWGSKGLTM